MNSFCKLSIYTSYTYNRENTS